MKVVQFYRKKLFEYILGSYFKILNYYLEGRYNVQRRQEGMLLKSQGDLVIHFLILCNHCMKATEPAIR